MVHALRNDSKAEIDLARTKVSRQEETSAQLVVDEPRQRGYFSGNQARLRTLAEDKRIGGLCMGGLNDPQEAEAVRVGSAVTRMTDADLSSRTGAPQYAVARSNSLQRDERAITGDPAPPIVHEALRSSGDSLDPATRAFMEPRFGQDFSQVRVRSGPLAERSARAVDARAYSVGNDIVLGTSRFSPESREARETVAHELAHVAQQRSAQGDAARVVRRQPAQQTAPMPLDKVERRPTVLPINLTEADRDHLSLAAITRIDKAYPNFLAACKAHMESIKAADKAKTEMVAALVGVFFGLAAPVFSSWVMGAGGTALTSKLASILSTEGAKKVNEAIKQGDLLKEGFKAVGAIATTAIKANPSLLFGESDVDAFGTQLQFQFGAGVSALTDAIAAHELRDEALIATFFAYDYEFTNVLAYRETLNKIFEEFKSLVRPIGRESFGNEAMSSETTTRGEWVVGLGGKKELFVSRKVEVLYPPTNGGLDSETLQPVPDDIKSFVIAKTEREFGKVETIISPEESARLAAEAEKARRPKPIVTPIPLEEAAASTGDWISARLAKEGRTRAIRKEILMHLEEYQGNARDIFIVHVRKAWNEAKPAPGQEEHRTHH